MDRRRFLIASVTGAATAGASAAAADVEADSDAEAGNSFVHCDAESGACELTEIQQGDPALAVESVSFSTKEQGRMQSALRRAVLANRLENFRERFFEKAVSFVGVNRDDNAETITEFCNTLKIPFRYKSGGAEKYTAYCAAGISYVASLIYAEQYEEDLRRQKRSKQQRYMPEIAQYHFSPTVSCVNMFHSALGARRWRRVAEARKAGVKRGWVAVFDWKASGNFYRADHCGIVDGLSADGSRVKTVEFNTSPEGVAGSQSNGGFVARRTRSFRTIKGFIDTDARDPFSIFQ